MPTPSSYRKTDTIHGIYQPLFLQPRSYGLSSSRPPLALRVSEKMRDPSNEIAVLLPRSLCSSHEGNETGLEREALSHLTERNLLYVIHIAEPLIDSLNSKFNGIFCYRYGLHNSHYHHDHLVQIFLPFHCRRAHQVTCQWHIVKYELEWTGVEWTGFVKHAVDL